MEGFCSECNKNNCGGCKKYEDNCTCQEDRFYCGEDVKCLDIKKGDSEKETQQKIINAICDLKSRVGVKCELDITINDVVVVKDENEDYYYNTVDYTVTGGLSPYTYYWDCRWLGGLPDYTFSVDDNNVLSMNTSLYHHFIIVPITNNIVNPKTSYVGTLHVKVTDANGCTSEDYFAVFGGAQII